MFIPREAIHETIGAEEFENAQQEESSDRDNIDIQFGNDNLFDNYA